MLTLGQTLSYYKRKNVMQLILRHAENKEIGVRFNDSFGKRPDIVQYENDVLEFAKKGVTSFHCSEELWHHPLSLDPNLKRKDLDELRSGWDLILDIDCPYWQLSKLMAYVCIKALKDHGIETISLKFSGGKGFHIGVPFESFPDTMQLFNEEKQKIETVEVKNLFPEGPRKIAAYLLHYIEENLIVPDNATRRIRFGKVFMTYDSFMKHTGKSEEELFVRVCKKCSSPIKNAKEHAADRTEFICPYCETRVMGTDEKYMSCPKCKRVMERHHAKKKALCSECGSNDVIEKIDFSKIVEVDTVLISSRHLYRMAYSLHEKTGLVSMPFDVTHILKFEKEEATPEKIIGKIFLDREHAKKGEAKALFQKAFDYKSEKERKNREHAAKRFDDSKKEYAGQTLAQEAIPEQFFPPCIQHIAKGLEDGKKRAVLVLINFLGACGWEYEKIESYVLAWNEHNKPDQLRETYLRGQLRYYKMQKEKMAPPNCDNKGYMVDTRFCHPDAICRKIKNPAQYAKRKAWMASMDAPKKKGKKPSVEEKTVDEDRS